MVSKKISISNLIDEMIEYELKKFGMINIHSKIFIAGHKGMLGSSVFRIFKKKDIRI